MSPSSSTHRAVLVHRLLAMLIILAGLAPMEAPTLASSMMPQCRFDPDGYFYIKGGPPQGFEEIDHIRMLVTDKNGRGPNAESRLFVKNASAYRFARLSEFRTHSSGAGITFEFSTEIIKGVNYQFSGKFTSICVLAQTERDPETPVAIGTLLKFKKGQQKGSADVELTYSNSPRRQTSTQSNDGADPEAGTGREVLAIVKKIELKAYTDDLGNGKAVVSDIIHFEVVEPKELTHITVTAYYQGSPEVQGRRLQVRDHVRFELPRQVQRNGILLADLKGLRFRE